MLDYWVSKIKEVFKDKDVSKFKEILLKFVKCRKVSNSNPCHLINLSILVVSYVLGSLLIYPEFKISVFFKELFSIICIYGAIFCWFSEKFSENNVLIAGVPATIHAKNINWK